MKLPPTYDCPAALARIRNGLVKLGCAERHAEWAAQTALDEAPFAAPTEEGWLIASKRARFLAARSKSEVDLYASCPDGIHPIERL